MAIVEVLPQKDPLWLLKNSLDIGQISSFIGFQRVFLKFSDRIAGFYPESDEDMSSSTIRLVRKSDWVRKSRVLCWLCALRPNKR
jgi:hypothetical protein